ncbi:MAG: amidohydrolase family protein [bacterium]|jgi:imidazolonepropionase-like amidohydrolase|tara:strand:- start:956 stop:2281 length:1326 start_codon:yes stop_codon:yes gene_type:complete
MMIKIIFTLFLFSLGISNDQIPGEDQKRPIILKGGILHTVSTDIFEGYDILFSKGKIVRIEKNIMASPETDVYDVFGKHIIPGYIAPITRIGLVEIGLVKQTRDFAERGSFNPNVKANVSYNPDSDLIPITRSNGVLVVNSVPAGGRISGQSSVMMLDGWTWEQATLKHPSGLHINWPSMRINYGANVKKSEKQQKEEIQKSIRDLDHMVRDVRAYFQRIKQRSRIAGERQKSDLRLESMIPFVVEKKKIFIHADEARQIKSAVEWAKKNDLKIIIVGGSDSWRLTDLLVKNNIPVVIDQVEKIPTRRFEPIHLPYKLPFLLKQAGVQFCLNTIIGYPHDGNIRNLPNEAMRAAAYGLDKSEALRSITLSTAEILGVDDMIGSLDIGKDATFFISETPPMEMNPKILMAFIQGKEVDLNNHQKMLYKKYQEKYRRQGQLNQ